VGRGGAKTQRLGLEQRACANFVKICKPIPKLGCLLGTVTVEWEEERVL
jgi:hypothetical protein